MNNTSDTQHIPHIPHSFIDPPMDPTLKVGVPPVPPDEHSGTIRARKWKEQKPPHEPTSEPLPPAQEATAHPNVSTVQTQPMTRLAPHLPPCSYALLWKAHHDDCASMRTILLILFTIFILAFAAYLSLTMFLVSGITLCVAFLLMLVMRRDA